MPRRKGAGKLDVRTLTDAREDIDCKKWSDPKKYICKGQHTHTQAYVVGEPTLMLHYWLFYSALLTHFFSMLKWMGKDSGI